MLFKKKHITENFNSPVIGQSIPLENVKDDVFSQKLLGDGKAFIFEGDTIYSPCNGKIKMIADTKHAFGIVSDNGTEILLHIGLETVNLNGKGMRLLVEKNEKIKKNKPILKIDRDFMKKNNIDLTVMLIVINTPDYEISKEKDEEVNLDSIVLRAKKIRNI